MATKMTREEALNKVRQMSLPKETMEILEALAPELAESKDERIRRKMIEHFKAKTKETWCNMPVKDIIAYLEKQKEQKPAEWSEEDSDILRDAICAADILAKDFKKDNPHVAKTLRVAKEWLESLPERFTLPIKQEWDEFDEDCLKRAIWYVENPAPSVVKDTNLALWLKSLPERKNLPPKQEWNKEDEKKIIFLERLIEHNVPDGQYGWVDGMKGGFVTKSEAISMLKSLRPQYHGDVTMTEAYKMGLEAGKASSWKPSEEDLMMLEHIIGQYEIGNKNSKVMGYLPRIEELDFLKKVLAKWKN